MPSKRNFFRGAAMALLAVGAGGAQCVPPHFQVARDYGMGVFVSLKPRDLTFENLRCLSTTFRASRPGRRSFGVSFFDSLEAAKHFMGTPAEGPRPPEWEVWARHFRAGYSFDAGTNEESISISPLGFNSAPSETTNVDLRSSGSLDCRVRVANRCLMSGPEVITYPAAALQQDVTSRVVLAGVIGKDGQVKDVRAQGVHKAQGQEAALVRASTRDLRLWRFDTAPADTSFEITYDFIIDSLYPPSAVPMVRWSAPNTVEIRSGR